MGKMGFDTWFEVLTVVSGCAFGKLFFSGNFEVALWVFIFWLYSLIIELKLMEFEEELEKERIKRLFL